MRFRRWLPALTMLPLALGGCAGTSSPSTSAPSKAAGANEQPWVVVRTGSATPSPKPAAGTGRPKPALPSVSFLPTSSACALGWPDTVGQVLIPMVITLGVGAIKVQWPNRYGNTYRVTAVPQALVSGAQPEPTWKTITTGSECEGSATITGLTSGAAYIVWLDAPNTPRDVDGTRSLYSGKSGVVKPQ